MRRLVPALLIALVAGPVLAADWVRFSDDGHGYQLDLPSGYLAGPATGDRHVFQSPDGRRRITVFGARSFYPFDWLSRRNRDNRIEDGWVVTEAAITPDWARYAAEKAGFVVHIHAIEICAGQSYAQVEFWRARSDAGAAVVAERLAASLRRSDGTDCTGR